MAESTFDAAHAVRFELPRGSVSAPDGDRMVLIASSVLDDFIRAAEPQVVLAFGRALGAAMGKRISARLGGTDKVRGATLEAALDHLGVEFSLAGLGMLSLERWGQALVFVLDDSCLANDSFLSATLEGMLEKSSVRDVACASLGRDGNRLRIFVGAKPTVLRVRGWLSEGTSWSDALRKLQTKVTKP